MWMMRCKQTLPLLIQGRKQRLHPTRMVNTLINSNSSCLLDSPFWQQWTIAIKCDMTRKQKAAFVIMAQLQTCF